MTTQELYNLTVESIVAKIENSVDLTNFARERAKFEGWLKVELIDILVLKGYNALPEINFIDVSFDKVGEVGIELKTVNTNFKYEKVKEKIIPITQNINDINDDINKLRKENLIDDKFVVFIVFPTNHEKNDWKKQLEHIKNNLENNQYLYKEFYFFGKDIPGVIYYGKIK